MTIEFAQDWGGRAPGTREVVGPDKNITPGMAEILIARGLANVSTVEVTANTQQRRDKVKGNRVAG